MIKIGFELSAGKSLGFLAIFLEVNNKSSEQLMSSLLHIEFSDHHYQFSMAAITQIKQGRNFRLKVRYCPKCGKPIGWR